MSTTYLNTTADRAKLLTDLNIYFGDDLTFWEADSRIFWMYNIDGTGTYTEKTNENLNLVGQIGIGTLTLGVDSQMRKTAVMVSKSTVSGKQQTLTSKLTQLTTAEPTYSLDTYYTFLYDAYLTNMSKMKNLTSYAKAVALTGVSNPTDAQVAAIMAQGLWSCKEDVPTIKPNEVVLDIVKIKRTTDSKPGLQAVLTVQGVDVAPQKCKWWLYPGENIIGITGKPATNISGEYVWGTSKFYIDTDLNNRKDWVIMNPKNVKVECLVSYLVDGVWTTILTSKVIDFSQDLPVYNYFGL